MANSRCPSPLGLDALQFDSELISARPAGQFGHPDTIAERFRLLPPLNFEDSVEYQVFEETVLNQHVKKAERLKRKRALDIPEAELDVVEGKHKLRKEVAERCRALLVQARTDLASEQAELLKKPPQERQVEERNMRAKGEMPATRVKRIGITSAYRSFAYDSELWHRYMRQKYYPITYSERAMLSCWEGGQYGWNASQSLVNFISKRKAAPGFSNHTNGIAVDFFTEEDGKTLQAETGQSNRAMSELNRRWERSWLYRWLQEHKDQYRIDRIQSEAWHWEFHG